MPTDTANYSDTREARQFDGVHDSTGEQRARRATPGPRVPSTAGYLSVASVIAITLFFAVWWLLTVNGDDAPWLPAILAASVTLLLAAAAREVVARRSWTRYTRELELEMGRDSLAARPGVTPKRRRGRMGKSQSSTLRALLQRLALAEEVGAQRPEAHLEGYHLCEQYLAGNEERANSRRLVPDERTALRAGQERVRVLRKHHLLAWARGESQRLTQEARRRVSVSDKIETAMRALEVLNEARQIYPGEPELVESAIAIRDYAASVKVAHWVEQAERAAFRGRHARAVARYQDALFYLSRSEISEGARAEIAAHIQREIENLRARDVAFDGAAGVETHPPREPSRRPRIEENE
ncbi:MAG: hypothetical protein ACRD9R_11340 [Pyrinomonadaceae bacterium]